MCVRTLYDLSDSWPPRRSLPNAGCLLPLAKLSEGSNTLTVECADALTQQTNSLPIQTPDLKKDVCPTIFFGFLLIIGVSPLSKRPSTGNEETFLSERIRTIEYSSRTSSCSTLVTSSTFLISLFCPSFVFLSEI